MKPINLRRRDPSNPVIKDAEGNTSVNYMEAVEIKATIWAAGGQKAIEMYGERLPYIKNMEYEGTEEIKEGDGICLDVDAESKPDYEVIRAVKDHKPHLFTLEKVRVRA